MELPQSCCISYQAFNNIKTESIREALECLGEEELITNWVMGMLESKTITSKVGSSTTRKTTMRGTPQGGVISPLIWLIEINKILLFFKEKRIKMIAYACRLLVKLWKLH